MERYFNYPLCLLQLIKNDRDKRGLLNITSFAVMNFSEKIGYRTDSVAKQIIYLYYRRPYFLTSRIKNRLDYLYEQGIINEDADYHGFAGDQFFPENEIAEFIPILNDDSSFCYDCTEVYKQHQALSILKLNPELITDLRDKYPSTKRFIESFERINGPDAWTSVSNEVLFNCFNDTLSMDHFRLISAVKSVLSKRNFNLTYKSVLLSRIFGCKKMHLLTALASKNPEIQSKYETLSKRRQWEKLINTAMERGYISYFCTGRQFFVSVTMPQQELKNAIQERKEKNDKIQISA